MARQSFRHFLITLKSARSLASPAAIRASTSARKSFSCSATAALSASMAAAQFALEPTARNSKRLPVKAKGEVRLRSVLSSRISGMVPTPSFISFFALMMIPLSKSAFSISFSASVSCDPRKTEMIAGGASLAPKRCAFVAEIIEALSKPLWRCTAINTFTKKVTNSKFW